MKQKNKQYYYSGTYKKAIEFWKRREKDTWLAFWASAIFLITSYLFEESKDITVSFFFCLVTSLAILTIQVKISMLVEDLNYVIDSYKK